MKTGFFIASAILCGMLFFSCNKAEYKEINYSKANGYFFKDSIMIEKVIQLKSQKEFDEYFGFSEDNANKINFKKSFAIVAFFAKVNYECVIYPKGLVAKGKNITYTYNIEMGRYVNESAFPFLIIVLDKKYLKYNFSYIKTFSAKGFN